MKPSTPGPQSCGCPSLTRDPRPRLLPAESTSTRTGPPSHQSPTSLLGSKGDGGQGQAYLPVAAGHTELEAELEGIQQQLQHYQTTKQNLW